MILAMPVTSKSTNIPNSQKLTSGNFLEIWKMRSFGNPCRNDGERRDAGNHCAKPANSEEKQDGIAERGDACCHEEMLSFEPLAKDEGVLSADSNNQSGTESESLQ
jgi:hypothetical protein